MNELQCQRVSLCHQIDDDHREFAILHCNCGGFGFRNYESFNRLILRALNTTQHFCAWSTTIFRFFFFFFKKKRYKHLNYYRRIRCSKL